MKKSHTDTSSPIDLKIHPWNILYKNIVTDAEFKKKNRIMKFLSVLTLHKTCRGKDCFGKLITYSFINFIISESVFYNSYYKKLKCKYSEVR